MQSNACVKCSVEGMVVNYSVPNTLFSTSAVSSNLDIVNSLWSGLDLCLDEIRDNIDSRVTGIGNFH